MKVLDKPIMALMRWSRRRRRLREVEEMALPGLEAYTPPVPSAERHTKAHGGAGGKLAKPKRVAVALATVAVLSGGGYTLGSTVASAAATEEADEQAIEDAQAAYENASDYENAALVAAVSAYSAEREAEGEQTPEEVAVERLQAEHNLSEMEAVDVARGDDSLMAVFTDENHIKAAAIEMWEANPPDGETVRESIQRYEAAVEEANDAESAYDNALHMHGDD